jgi:hypothetical protein
VTVSDFLSLTAWHKIFRTRLRHETGPESTSERTNPTKKRVLCSWRGPGAPARSHKVAFFLAPAEGLNRIPAAALLKASSRRRDGIAKASQRSVSLTRGGVFRMSFESRRVGACIRREGASPHAAFAERRSARYMRELRLFGRPSAAFDPHLLLAPANLRVRLPRASPKGDPRAGFCLWSPVRDPDP